MWGRHIMMGYIYREDATKKDMSEDGWLRTGDLADIDNEGFHRIVGREKDLIITAGGENIAPQPIHDKVKEALPIISQVKKTLYKIISGGFSEIRYYFVCPSAFIIYRLLQF